MAKTAVPDAGTPPLEQNLEKNYSIKVGLRSDTKNVFCDVLLKAPAYVTVIYFSFGEIPSCRFGLLLVRLQRPLGVFGRGVALCLI